MPKHTHVIEADSMGEFKELVAQLNSTLNGTVTSISPTVAGTADAAPAKAPKAAKPSPVKETEPVKEAEPEAEVVEEDDPFAEEAAEPEAEDAATEEVTRAQVDEAIKKVGASKAGLPAVRKICALLKVKKVKDIPEESFAKALDLCKKALK